MIEYIPLEMQNQIAKEYKRKVLAPRQKLKKAEQSIYDKIKHI